MTKQVILPVSQAIIDGFADQLASYRNNPFSGGWEQLKIRLVKTAKQHRISMSSLFDAVNRRYEERLAG